MESAIRLNYIETAGSILHEMPWVVVKEYKVITILVTQCHTDAYKVAVIRSNNFLLQENGPDLKWDDAKHICRKCVNKGTINFELILIYGHAGNVVYCSVAIVTVTNAVCS